MGEGADAFTRVTFLYKKKGEGCFASSQTTPRQLHFRRLSDEAPDDKGAPSLKPTPTLHLVKEERRIKVQGWFLNQFKRRLCFLDLVKLTSFNVSEFTWSIHCGCGKNLKFALRWIVVGRLNLLVLRRPLVSRAGEGDREAELRAEMVGRHVLLGILPVHRSWYLILIQGDGRRGLCRTSHIQGVVSKRGPRLFHQGRCRRPQECR
ncbi:uncharacterized protein LOC119997980 [Tripterygium wilfordii]|uniref:uncharacterized protein LOC119997980 n=1 Tax=Tripterygium wilfordii TaxID=458696 RepID=UPI0018F81662|nr:uncharacterized protein LOC119997980 [Tripterygium wilfordii]